MDEPLFPEYQGFVIVRGTPLAPPPYQVSDDEDDEMVIIPIADTIQSFFMTAG